jgi:hypothetical protein
VNRDGRTGVLGHNALSPVATVIMLDRHWVWILNDINDLSDDDLNAAVAVITYVRLNRNT